MNFIIWLLLSPNINFVKVKKRVVKIIIIYYILLNSLLIQIKLYRYVDIYYLKLLQHLGGAIVGSFLKNILPQPRVPLLLLGGRASCRALVELYIELNVKLYIEPQQSFVQSLSRALYRALAELYIEPQQSFIQSLCRAIYRAICRRIGIQLCKRADIYTGD